MSHLHGLRGFSFLRRDADFTHLTSLASGGSVRIPAHFSGCYALKPSAGRFTNFGIQQCNPGFEGVKSAMGPMGRSVADLELMARVALDGAPQLALTQTNLLPVPYRDVKLPTDRPLRFGYFLHDGFCAASPACERAVMETVEALRKAGHEVIEFEPTPGECHFCKYRCCTDFEADVPFEPQLPNPSNTSLPWHRQVVVSAPWTLHEQGTRDAENGLLTQMKSCSRS